MASLEVKTGLKIPSWNRMGRTSMAVLWLACIGPIVVCNGGKVLYVSPYLN